jgi:hypothetical protein
MRAEPGRKAEIGQSRRTIDKGTFVENITAVRAGAQTGRFSVMSFLNVGTYGAGATMACGHHRWENY